jgi:hypothetical protein
MRLVDQDIRLTRQFFKAASLYDSAPIALRTVRNVR